MPAKLLFSAFPLIAQLAVHSGTSRLLHENGTPSSKLKALSEHNLKFAHLDQKPNISLHFPNSSQRLSQQCLII